jgi:hypothetical protein
MAACLMLAALLLLPVQQAHAGRWGRSDRKAGWSRSVSVYRNGGGNFGRTTTITRPNGQTATRTFNRSVSNGTITDTHSATGFDGKTRSGTLTRTPGQGGTASYTGRNGQTSATTFSR